MTATVRHDAEKLLQILHGEHHVHNIGSLSSKMDSFINSRVATQFYIFPIVTTQCSTKEFKINELLLIKSRVCKFTPMSFMHATVACSHAIRILFQLYS